MMKVKISKFKVNNFLFGSFFIFCCLMFTVYGCGYSLHGKAALPFDSIRIVKIENKTLEPKLQDRLYAALTEEFLKQGISVAPDAPNKLSGTITQFELRILSEKSNIAREYEVVIKANFVLTDQAGNKKEFKDLGSPFIVSFSGPGSLNELIASKEDASDNAVKDMAAEIVAVLIYK